MRRAARTAVACVTLLAASCSEPSPTAQQGPPSDGTTWDSLAALPNFLGASWVPANAGVDEKTLLNDLPMPPLKEPYVAAAKTAMADIAGGSAPLPTAGCRFDGMPRLAWYPYPVDFLYGAGHVMIRQNDFVRDVPVGSTEHPQLYSVNGDISGRWEGDTLVVDTVRTRGDVETFYGVANDPDLNVVERYRLIGGDRLERRTTITSPAFFAAPWEITTIYEKREAAPWATKFCVREDAP